MGYGASGRQPKDWATKLRSLGGIVLHDRECSQGNIDHLFICADGVAVIDSKPAVVTSTLSQTTGCTWGAWISRIRSIGSLS